MELGSQLGELEVEAQWKQKPSGEAVVGEPAKATPTKSAVDKVSMQVDGSDDVGENEEV